MPETVRRRLRAFLLAAAIASTTSCGGASAVRRAASPSPKPSVAAQDATLSSLLTHAGLDADFGPDWGAYDMPNGNGRDFGTALLLGREKPGSTLWIEFDPANRRSLSRYVHDHRRQLGYPPAAGHPSRICHGTQDAWEIELTDRRMHSDRRLTSIAVLTINRVRGLVVVYSFARKAPADSRMRAALANMCLSASARGIE